MVNPANGESKLHPTSAKRVRFGYDGFTAAAVLDLFDGTVHLRVLQRIHG